MLMDEPFSALDALTRGTLQDEVRRICLETGQTAFMITHDVDEAIYLADKIVLMTNGPGAVLAEIVENPLPKDRGRARSAPASALLRGAQPHRSISWSAAARPSAADDRRITIRASVPVVRPGAERTDHRRRRRRQVETSLGAGDRALITKGETNMKREDLTEKLLDIKREKGWSWKHICEEIGGMSEVLIVGAHPRPDEADQAAGRQGRRAVRAVRNPRSACSTRCRCAARHADAADRSADLPLLRDW